MGINKNKPATFETDSIGGGVNYCTYFQLRNVLLLDVDGLTASPNVMYLHMV